MILRRLIAVVGLAAFAVLAIAGGAGARGFNASASKVARESVAPDYLAYLKAEEAQRAAVERVVQQAKDWDRATIAQPDVEIAEDGSFKVAILTNKQGPTNGGVPDAIMSMFSIGNRPALDCQFSAGAWTYSAASFTAPGTGCVVPFSQTTPTTMLGPDGLLTYGPNNAITHSIVDTNWQQSDATITNASVPGPGNPATLALVTESSGSAFHNINIGGTAATGANFIASATLAAGTRRYVALFVGTGGTNYVGVIVDTQTWTITDHAGQGTGVYITSGINATPNSTYQVYFKGTLVSGNLTLQAQGSAASTISGAFNIITSGGSDTWYMGGGVVAAVTHETTPRSQDQVITGASAYYGPRDDNGCQYPTTIANCGLLIEQASANEEPNARDMTQASWTKGATITVAHTATGIDGVANSANLITGGATTATNTVCGALTITSEAQTGSFYIEPVTVTGAVNISINGGSTWTNIAGSLISSEFVRPSAEATLANPSLCVQVANNNDQIIVDANQVEDLAFPTSFIPTGASQVSRAADVDSQSVSAYNLQSGGALLVKAITPNNNVATQVFAALDDATTNNYVRLIYATNGHVEALIESGGSLQATIDLGAVANSTLIRVGVNFVGGKFAASLNGAAVVMASGTMPASLTTVRYGMASSGSQLNSWIQRPQIYKAINNNNQLQAKVAAL